MKRELAIVRALYIEGRHLNNCFTSPARQAEGLKLIYRAKRIATRLGYKLTALMPTLTLLALLKEVL